MLPIERTIVPHAILGQELVTFSPTITVREAVKEMAARRIGAAMIVESGKLVGIFTERDVLVRVVAADRDPGTTTLAEVMTRDPQTIKASDAVVLALEMMNQRGYRHLPVTEGERLVGIVSIRDLHRTIKEQMDEDLLMLAETLIQG